MGEGPIAKKKRKRFDPANRRQRPRKLQKTAPTDVGKIIAPPSRDADKVTSTENFRATRLDNLIWKEVPLPDVLDDYEGFYGLEEVDDVEVVRQGNIVSYKAAKERDVKEKRAEGWGIGEDEKFEDGTREDGDVDVGEQEVDEVDEWAGFSDAEEIAPVPVKALTKKEKRQLAKEARNSKVSEANGPSSRNKVLPAIVSNPTTQSNDNTIEQDSDEDAEPTSHPLDDDLATNGFAGLSDEDLDEGDIDNKNWLSLPINPMIRAALGKMNFNNPTPIQKAVIPDIIDGHDVVGKAATGSGKTLAYGIPLLEVFLSEEKTSDGTQEDEHIPTALILAPTRELAIQINTHLTPLHDQLEGRRPRLATVTGGLAVQKQQRLLAKADIIIATPGRLWDVVSSSSGLMTRLKQARFIVIDEADRLLSEGHFKEVDEILTALNRTFDDQVYGQTEEEESDEDTKDVQQQQKGLRQTLVFSATFSKDLQQKLANRKKRHQIASKASADMSTDESLNYLLAKLPFQAGQKPKFIDVNPVSAMAPNLREALVECPTPLDC